MSNKKKRFKEAVMKSIIIAATTTNEEEMAKALRTLPRRDRRILVREGKKRQEKRSKQTPEGSNGTQTGNLQDSQG